MLQPAVSPDGKWIAFGFGGQLYKVSSKGGQAIQLTFTNCYNGYPIWSHDSRRIAFAADAHGNFDIYLMAASGGSVKRLTYESGADIPRDFSPDDAKVLFTAARHDSYESVRFPGGYFYSKLHAVPVKGGPAVMLNGAGMDYAHFNPTGNELIFQDIKGSEFNFRKHNQSSVTKDIWVYHTKDKTYQQLTTRPGDDREPVWGRGQEFYFLSERSGTLNVFQSSTADTATARQLTFFGKYPVRSLSRSADGLLVFSYNGEIYSLNAGGSPQKISVALSPSAIVPTADTTSFPLQHHISEMAVSRDGKQLAFICRGDIFVASADGSSVRNITHTPWQERMVSFSPDGKKLLFSKETGTSWDLAEASIAGSDATCFYNAAAVRFNDILNTSHDEFQGAYSPDGTKIAYIEDRDILKFYDLKQKKSYTLIPEGVNFSSKDGDQYFRWSPDSKSLVAQSTEGGGGFDNEVVMVSADSSAKRTNLTKSGFKDDKPQWSADGKMIYWLTDRDAYRNFTDGSHFDIYALSADSTTWNEVINGQSISSRNSSQTQGFINAQLNRISTASADVVGTVLSRNSKKLYHLSKYEEGYDLWAETLSNHRDSLIARLNLPDAIMETDSGVTRAFILSGGQILSVDLADGKTNKLKITPGMVVNLTAERDYIFQHVVNNVRTRFMDPKYNGTDWDSYTANYRRVLVEINNNRDFTGLLGELLGELNTSHTFSRFSPAYAHPDETAALGLFYDITWQRSGLSVKEVIKGGPFDHPGTQMKPGMIIDQIDGQILDLKADWARLLNHKSGQKVAIRFHKTGSDREFSESVVPVTSDTETDELLYDRWIRQMEHLTDSLSGGRLGYIHVQAMNDGSFRSVYDKALGRFKNKEALIIDTRFNRGGSLHEELTNFLSGQIYLTERRQGRLTSGGEPVKRWNKPSCILMSESNYSDAYLTPFIYKMKKIGKLIGAPVQGSGTASWYEPQIDPQLAIQIAVGGTYGPGDQQPTENRQLEPDILIYNSYDKILHGHDEQLKAAVDELLAKKQE